MPLALPAQQEIARETSMALRLKNQASHLLRGECYVVRLGKRELKMAVTKRQRKEKPVKMEQKKTQGPE